MSHGLEGYLPGATLTKRFAEAFYTAVVFVTFRVPYGY